MGGMLCAQYQFIWRSRAPSKVQFFCWLLVQGRIQCRSNLLRKNILEKKNSGCALCGADLETPEHVVFECTFARQFWNALGADSPPPTRCCEAGTCPLPPSAPARAVPWCRYLRSSHPACAPQGYVDYLALFYCACGGGKEELWWSPWLGVATIGLWLLLLFYLLGDTASEYFCASLEGLSAALRLAPAVAGVTLLSLGNGAPDVLFSVVSFASGGGNGAGDVGLSGSLGGALFVSTVVVGLVTIVSARRHGGAQGAVVIDRRGFVRDVGFLLIALCYLFAVLLAGTITVWAAAAFLSLYAAYVLLVSASQYCCPCAAIDRSQSTDHSGELAAPLRLGHRRAPLVPCQRRHGVTSALLAPLLLVAVTCPLRPTFLLAAALTGALLAVVAASTTESATPPHGRHARLLWLAGGFLMSVLWSYVLARELVAMLVSTGIIAGIPERGKIILGVTVLAWGNSLGDLVSDVASWPWRPKMARRGAQTTVAGCYAGPAFNMVVGLGLSMAIAAAGTYPETGFVRGAGAGVELDTLVWHAWYSMPIIIFLASLNRPTSQRPSISSAYLTAFGATPRRPILSLTRSAAPASPSFLACRSQQRVEGDHHGPDAPGEHFIEHRAGARETVPGTDVLEDEVVGHGVGADPELGSPWEDGSGGGRCRRGSGAVCGRTSRATAGELLVVPAGLGSNSGRRPRPRVRPPPAAVLPSGLARDLAVLLRYPFHHAPPRSSSPAAVHHQGQREARGRRRLKVYEEEGPGAAGLGSGLKVAGAAGRATPASSDGGGCTCSAPSAPSAGVKYWQPAQVGPSPATRTPTPRPRRGSVAEKKERWSGGTHSAREREWEDVAVLAVDAGHLEHAASPWTTRSSRRPLALPPRGAARSAAVQGLRGPLLRRLLHSDELPTRVRKLQYELGLGDGVADLLALASRQCRRTAPGAAAEQVLKDTVLALIQEVERDSCHILITGDINKFTSRRNAAAASATLILLLLLLIVLSGGGAQEPRGEVFCAGSGDGEQGSCQEELQALDGRAAQGYVDYLALFYCACGDGKEELWWSPWLGGATIALWLLLLLYLLGDTASEDLSAALRLPRPPWPGVCTAKTRAMPLRPPWRAHERILPSARPLRLRCRNSTAEGCHIIIGLRRGTWRWAGELPGEADGAALCQYLQFSHPPCAPQGYVDYLALFYCACDDGKEEFWSSPWLGGATITARCQFLLSYLLGDSASEYFCASLEGLSAALRLPSTVAGAPDVLSSVVSFASGGGNGAGDVGLGGALFVCTVVAGVVTSRLRGGAEDGFVIERRGFVRDVSFQLIALCYLFAVLLAGTITVWAAAALLSLYAAYVLLVSASHCCPCAAIDRSRSADHSDDLAVSLFPVVSNSKHNKQQQLPTLARFIVTAPLYLPRRLTIPDIAAHRWSRANAVTSALLGAVTCPLSPAFLLAAALLAIAAALTTDSATPPHGRHTRLLWLCPTCLPASSRGIIASILGVRVLAWGNSLGDLASGMDMATQDGTAGAQTAVAGPAFSASPWTYGDNDYTTLSDHLNKRPLLHMVQQGRLIIPDAKSPYQVLKHSNRLIHSGYDIVKKANDLGISTADAWTMENVHVFPQLSSFALKEVDLSDVRRLTATEKQASFVGYNTFIKDIISNEHGAEALTKLPKSLGEVDILIAGIDADEGLSELVVNNPVFLAPRPKGMFYMIIHNLLIKRIPLLFQNNIPIPGFVPTVTNPTLGSLLADLLKGVPYTAGDSENDPWAPSSAPETQCSPASPWTYGDNDYTTLSDHLNKRPLLHLVQQGRLIIPDAKSPYQVLKHSNRLIHSGYDIVKKANDLGVSTADAWTMENVHVFPQLSSFALKEVDLSDVRPLTATEQQASFVGYNTFIKDIISNEHGAEALTKLPKSLGEVDILIAGIDADEGLSELVVNNPVFLAPRPKGMFYMIIHNLLIKRIPLLFQNNIPIPGFVPTVTNPTLGSLLADLLKGVPYTAGDSENDPWGTIICPRNPMFSVWSTALAMSRDDAEGLLKMLRCGVAHPLEQKMIAAIINAKAAAAANPAVISTLHTDPPTFEEVIMFFDFYFPKLAPSLALSASPWTYGDNDYTTLSDHLNKRPLLHLVQQGRLIIPDAKSPYQVLKHSNRLIHSGYDIVKKANDLGVSTADHWTMENVRVFPRLSSFALKEVDLSDVRPLTATEKQASFVGYNTFIKDIISNEHGAEALTKLPKSLGEVDILIAGIDADEGLSELVVNNPVFLAPRPKGMFYMIIHNLLIKRIPLLFQNNIPIPGFVPTVTNPTLGSLLADLLKGVPYTAGDSENDPWGTIICPRNPMFSVWSTALAMSRDDAEGLLKMLRCGVAHPLEQKMIAAIINAMAAAAANPAVISTLHTDPPTFEEVIIYGEASLFCWLQHVIKDIISNEHGTEALTKLPKSLGEVDILIAGIDADEGLSELVVNNTVFLAPRPKGMFYMIIHNLLIKRIPLLFQNNIPIPGFVPTVTNPTLGSLLADLLKGVPYTAGDSENDPWGTIICPRNPMFSVWSTALAMSRDDAEGLLKMLRCGVAHPLEQKMIAAIINAKAAAAANPAVISTLHTDPPTFEEVIIASPWTYGDNDYTTLSDHLNKRPLLHLVQQGRLIIPDAKSPYQVLKHSNRLIHSGYDIVKKANDLGVSTADHWTMENVRVFPRLSSFALKEVDLSDVRPLTATEKQASFVGYNTFIKDIISNEHGAEALTKLPKSLGEVDILIAGIDADEGLSELVVNNPVFLAPRPKGMFYMIIHNLLIKRIPLLFQNNIPIPGFVPTVTNPTLGSLLADLLKGVPYTAGDSENDPWGTIICPRNPMFSVWSTALAMSRDDAEGLLKMLRCGVAHPLEQKMIAAIINAMAAAAANPAVISTLHTDPPTFEEVIIASPWTYGDNDYTTLSDHLNKRPLLHLVQQGRLIIPDAKSPYQVLKHSNRLIHSGYDIVKKANDLGVSTADAWTMENVHVFPQLSSFALKEVDLSDVRPLTATEKQASFVGYNTFIKDIISNEHGTEALTKLPKSLGEVDILIAGIDADEGLSELVVNNTVFLAPRPKGMFYMIIHNLLIKRIPLLFQNNIPIPGFVPTVTNPTLGSLLADLLKGVPYMAGDSENDPWGTIICPRNPMFSVWSTALAMSRDDAEGLLKMLRCGVAHPLEQKMIAAIINAKAAAAENPAVISTLHTDPPTFEEVIIASPWTYGDNDYTTLSDHLNKRPLLHLVQQGRLIIPDAKSPYQVLKHSNRLIHSGYDIVKKANDLGVSTADAWTMENVHVFPQLSSFALKEVDLSDVRPLTATEKQASFVGYNTFIKDIISNEHGTEALTKLPKSLGEVDILIAGIDADEGLSELVVNNTVFLAPRPKGMFYMIIHNLLIKRIPLLFQNNIPIPGFVPTVTNPTLGSLLADLLKGVPYTAGDSENDPWGTIICPRNPMFSVWSTALAMSRDDAEGLLKMLRCGVAHPLEQKMIAAIINAKAAAAANPAVISTLHTDPPTFEEVIMFFDFYFPKLAPSLALSASPWTYGDNDYTTLSDHLNKRPLLHLVQQGRLIIPDAKSPYQVLKHSNRLIHSGYDIVKKANDLGVSTAGAWTMENVHVFPQLSSFALKEVDLSDVRPLTATEKQASFVGYNTFIKDIISNEHGTEALTKLPKSLGEVDILIAGIDADEGLSELVVNNTVFLAPRPKGMFYMIIHNLLIKRIPLLLQNNIPIPGFVPTVTNPTLGSLLADLLKGVPYTAGDSENDPWGTIICPRNPMFSVWSTALAMSRDDAEGLLKMLRCGVAHPLEQKMIAAIINAKAAAAANPAVISTLHTDPPTFEEVDLSDVRPLTATEKQASFVGYNTFIKDIISNEHGAEALTKLPKSLGEVDILIAGIDADEGLSELVVNNPVFLAPRPKGMFYMIIHNLLIKRIPLLFQNNIPIPGFVPTVTNPTLGSLLADLLKGVPYTAGDSENDPWGTIICPRNPMFSVWSTALAMSRDDAEGLLKMLRCGVAHPLEQKMIAAIINAKAAAAANPAVISTLHTDPPTFEEVIMFFDFYFPKLAPSLALRIPLLFQNNIPIPGFVPTVTNPTLGSLLADLLKGVPYTAGDSENDPWGTIICPRNPMFSVWSTALAMSRDDAEGLLKMLRCGVAHPLEQKMIAAIINAKAAAAANPAVISTLHTDPPTFEEVIMFFDFYFPKLAPSLALRFYKCGVYHWLKMGDLFPLRSVDSR
ncbi:unnamed protein product [Alopecurus aequalis]